jgi:hypothetical protein
MLRKLIKAVAILALLGGPAAALLSGPAAAQVAMSPFKKQEKKLTPEEIEKQKQTESAYHAAMDKIPEKKTTVDPWGNIRTAPSQAAK